MKIILQVAFLFVVAIASATDNFVHYYDQRVLRITIKDATQIELVEQLNGDVWSHHSTLQPGQNDVMLNSTQEATLKSYGIDYTVLIPDVEELVANERDTQRQLQAQSGTGAYNFDRYLTLAELNAFYQNLSATYPDLITYKPSIGKSIEQRDIPALLIGKNTNKKIYIEGGQHAREWIGFATVAYIVNEIVSKYSIVKEVTDLVDNIQIVVVPFVNPDGYAYTHTSQRLWRKNRRLNPGGASYGVDLNRNWDDHWGGGGSSSSPSSDTYRGEYAFSEPETLAVSKFILENKPYAFAVDYHSYSQLILRPYGWTESLPPNDATASLVGSGIAKAIYDTYRVTYTSQHSIDLYITTGTASDWFYGKAEVPLSYTIELRDTGNYGFTLPPTQIIPTGEENWNAFLYYATYVLKN